MIARPRPGRLHVIVAEPKLGVAAAAGGADVVQYRDKSGIAPAHRLEVARRLCAGVGRLGGACIINDHPEIAVAAAAAGVHVGAHDPSVAAARQQVGPAMWVGATANTLEQAIALDREDVDYLGVGPVFPTVSKERPAAPLGIEGLARIVAAVRHPVIAIGGIDLSNAAEVIGTGAWGIAVLSAVTTADDAQLATARLSQCVAEGVSV